MWTTSPWVSVPSPHLRCVRYSEVTHKLPLDCILMQMHVSVCVSFFFFFASMVFKMHLVSSDYCYIGPFPDPLDQIKKIFHT